MRKNIRTRFKTNNRKATHEYQSKEPRGPNSCYLLAVIFSTLFSCLSMLPFFKQTLAVDATKIVLFFFSITTRKLSLMKHNSLVEVMSFNKVSTGNFIPAELVKTLIMINKILISFSNILWHFTAGKLTYSVVCWCGRKETQEHVV